VNPQTLADLQEAFLEALKPRRAGDTSNSSNANNTSPRPDPTWVASPASQPASSSSAAPSPQDKLQIYQHCIEVGHQKVLAAAFPAIKRLLGEDFFYPLCDRFFWDRPVAAPDLNDYGEEFSAFLQDFPALQDYPYLGDVAKVEWVWQRIWYEKEDAPFDFAGFEKASAQEDFSPRFRLASAAGFVWSSYPVVTIWQANREENKPESEETIHLDKGPEGCFLWRKEGKREIYECTPEEGLLLKGISAGKDVLTLEEDLKQAGVDAEKALLKLPQWIAWGWLQWEESCSFE